LKIFMVEAPRRYLFSHEDEDIVKSVVELIILPDILGRKPAGYIHKVYTDERFRNRGYASKLVKEALMQAKKEGCHKAFLVCDETTVPFYEKLGMKRHQMGMEVEI